ncbi:hypothetical protein BX666DRAFT_1934913 [Dichotomocladium elegans]|nr:hypothetical protein BX666DRAFT_1934913 [Dichotomocladium elegans]
MEAITRWKQSSSKLLCLDLRSTAAFRARHLVPSTHIPWHQLHDRCAELPPKNVPFAVMEPADLDGKGVSWLEERGWQCPWVFRDDDDAVWTADAAIVEHNALPARPTLMFSACPFLVKQMDMMEGGLQRKRTCLDIGCGSGRDVAWLMATRDAWEVVAVDSIAGALKRTRALATHLGVEKQLLKTIQAKVMADGGWKALDEEGTSSSSSSSQVEEESAASKAERFSPGIATQAFFESMDCPGQYDLVLTIRFLVRSLLPQLPDLLKPGGFALISHFVDDGLHVYDQPRKSHRLNLGELAALYGKREDVDVVVDVIEEIEDGRPVNSVIIRKKRAEI